MTEQILTIDCSEGAVELRDLTASERAQLDRDRQAAAAEAAAQAAIDANRQQLVDRVTQAIANLRAFADGLDANTLTAAQQRAALALCCRTNARLVRLVLSELDAAD